jgi:2-keto-4-pentenoate hydratase/2-oxohepta-3-ene-1,7-dioic acid hydratase in catechol pathway
MRLISIGDRAHIEVGAAAIDVEIASGGRLPSDPQRLYDVWDELVAFADTLSGVEGTPYRAESLTSPVPRPAQVFAVGLNYAEHADESGFDKPAQPVIFTKFVSSITGPVTSVALPEGHVDWEVELVVVLKAGGRSISAQDAWSHVAGVTVGQDLSERRLQHSGPAPQFSLAKSHDGFSPIGPAVVTADELGDIDDLALGAAINGEQVQAGRTSQLVFGVPSLIEHLSAVVELYPGDVIFTGTPSGVGAGRKPPRFLAVGDVLTSWIDGVGELRQTFVDRHAEVESQNGQILATRMSR